jgi:hypothetical protein
VTFVIGCTWYGAGLKIIWDYGSCQASGVVRYILFEFKRLQILNVGYAADESMTKIINEHLHLTPWIHVSPGIPNLLLIYGGIYIYIYIFALQLSPKSRPSAVYGIVNQFLRLLVSK